MNMESTETLRQNLKDAGCDEETIKLFIDDWQTGSKAKSLKLLAIHRKTLLNSLHENQKCIDILDYLLYQIKKAQK